MHNKLDIEKILQTGFTRLPIDDQTVAQATDVIVQRSKMARKENLLPVWYTEPRWLYALAAAVILVCSFTLLHFYKSSIPFDLKTANHTPDKPKKQQITILSHVGKNNALPANNIMETDGQSQLLVALGRRTRIILFENSKLIVTRADSMHLEVALGKGAIAVDVAPGGFDTVSVRTPDGVFTQIGTRFSVHFDSLRGAKLEVFRGKVRVQDGSGTDLPVAVNQTWKSTAKRTIAELNRSITEIEEIHKTFANNKIATRLLWNADLPKKAVLKPDFSIERDHLVSKEISNISILKTIQQLVDKEDYNKIDSIIAQLHDPLAADSISKLLRVIAERDAALFRFSKANNVLELVIGGKPFKMHQREDAWLRQYIIHKENVKSSTEEKLRMVKHYHNLFPQGTIGDDMLAESIQLQLVLQKYAESINDIKQLFDKYPLSIHSEYYHYVYASILREQLHKEKNALAAYKDYVSKYPKGKYEEDALYWIIQISQQMGDKSAVTNYKKTYIEKYSNGRWNEAVRAVGVTARNR